MFASGRLTIVVPIVWLDASTLLHTIHLAWLFIGAGITTIVIKVVHCWGRDTTLAGTLAPTVTAASCSISTCADGLLKLYMLLDVVFTEWIGT
jgi:hypothetical protein